MAAMQLGEVLKEIGLIDDMQLKSALAHQRQWGGRIGEVLVDQGFLDEMGLYETLARHFGMQLVSIPMLPISKEAVDAVPLPLALKHVVFPLKITDRMIAIATEDPRNVAAIDEIGFHTRKTVRAVLAPAREIDWAIRAYYHGENVPCPPPKVRLRFAAPLDEGDTMEIMDRRAINLPDDPLMLHTKPTPSQEGAPVMGEAPQPAAPSASYDDVVRLAHAVEGLQVAVRFLLDAGIARGQFTRDEYLRYVQEAQTQLPPRGR